MPTAQTASLLTQADPLPYPRRMALYAARARAWAGTTTVDGVLADLGKDRQHRDVALFLAVVAGHRPAIEAALADPDHTVHAMALTAWLRAGGPDAGQLAALLSDASAQTRRHVYRMLRRYPSPVLADGVIDRVRERYGDDEAGRLLPVCSPATVTRLLPELGHALGNWSLLGARHPEATLAEAARQLADLAAPRRPAWWNRFGAGVFAAVPAEPDRVLELLERYGPHSTLPGSMRDYALLARDHAGRVLALLTDPARAGWLVRAELPRTLLRRLIAHGGDGLVTLARRLRDNERALAALLRVVPPARRAALYDAAYADVDRTLSRPSDDILTLLPRARRYDEVRRVLRLAPVVAAEALTVSYTGFLPWDQARATLVAATRRATADERAAGYEALIACARRTGDPAVVGEAVEHLVRLRNEQDPVRSRALVALARVPAHLLRPELVPALRTITTGALEARDASSTTRNALRTLAVSVLHQHFTDPDLTGWTLWTLHQLFGDRIPALGRLDTQLRRSQETDVFVAVRDWLQAGVDRGEYDALFAVTRALRRRAWNVPGLQTMLGRAIDARNVSSVVRQAIVLWLDCPETRAARVEQVVRTDPSTVAVPEVWNVLCGRRTDLLDTVFEGPPKGGKFLAADVTWVPLHTRHVRRWLPRQRQAYAALLARVADDAGAKVGTRTAAIATAAYLPDVGPPIVHRYVDSPTIPLAEAALAALAWTPDPQAALPILLRHTGDDRARVAVYAAGRAASFVSPSRLGDILTAAHLDTGKVTSRKEVIRLAARMSVPGAGTVLRDAWRRDGQHPDVRAAVVSAARQRLHDPASWTILDEAVRAGRAEVLAVLAVADPYAIAERHRHAYGRLIAQGCRNPDEQVTRAAWLTFPRWAPWTGDVAGTVAARVTDLDDRMSWSQVVAALVGLLDAGLAADTPRQVVDGLARLDTRNPHDHPGRDRPARRRLTTVVEVIAGWSGRAAPDLDRAGLADAGRLLSRYPDFLPQATSLLLDAVPLHGGDPAALADALREICRLVKDRPLVAGPLAATLARRAGDTTRTDPHAALGAARILAGQRGPAPGLLAVALLGSGHRLGWPAPWRDQIRRMRRHNDPDVRAAALAVVLVPE